MHVLRNNSMNTVTLTVPVRYGAACRMFLRPAATILLSVLLLAGCGQQTAESSAEETSSASQSTGFISDGAINATRQAAQALEQKANAESVRISEETGKSADEMRQEETQALAEARWKTEQQLRAAAAEASRAANSQ